MACCCFLPAVSGVFELLTSHGLHPQSKSAAACCQFEYLGAAPKPSVRNSNVVRVFHNIACAAQLIPCCFLLQYMHIPSRDQCNWLRERIETKDPISYSPERKVHILDRLAWSEM